MKITVKYFDFLISNVSFNKCNANSVEISVIVFNRMELDITN